MAERDPLAAARVLLYRATECERMGFVRDWLLRRAADALRDAGCDTEAARVETAIGAFRDGGEISRLYEELWQRRTAA